VLIGGRPHRGQRYRELLADPARSKKPVHTRNLHARDPEIRRSPVALGLALLDTAAGVGSSRWAFVSGILITGGGLSCIFVPRSMVAMASVKPQLAGAASGLLNITRQLGSVPGSAAVDALLRNRLAATSPPRSLSTDSPAHCTPPSCSQSSCSRSPHWPASPSARSDQGA
jgi:hypothetical protein